MKTVTSFTLGLAGALLIVIASAAIAAAQTGSDTCAGLNATIGGTCTPLLNTTSNATGFNTAYGAGALQNNTSLANTAVGASALQSNTSGNSNTAIGVNALDSNKTGGFNTATGLGALQNNSSGSNNTATGQWALLNNGGDDNTATGQSALQQNGTGSNNTATGESALEGNFTGNSNSALGNGALNNNNSGSFNIGVGNNAGSNLTTGDNNIVIGNDGFAGDANTIRIGTRGTQTNTHIAGIFNSPGTKKACQVVVQSNGRLDCMASSARYKHDIRDMGAASDRLMKLRPVTFRYKDDTTGTAEYGLIAEEVEKVYPELVIDGSDGRAQTVAYQELPAMLLNEVQKERRQLTQKDAEIAAMRRQLAALQKKSREIDAIAERLNSLERQARASRPERVAAAIR